MRATRLLSSTVVFGFVLAGSLAAQAAAPKDATGQCTDGSYTTAKTQERGCLKHGGVKTWFGGGGNASAAASDTTAAPARKTNAAAKAPAAASTSASTGAAPKNATGQCTDGSYTTAKTQERGCLKHGGVKTWFGGAGNASAAAATAAPAAAAAPAVPKAASTAPAQAAAAAPARAAAPAQAPTNPSDVWVNTATKAYHCPGTKYYGTTKHGKYMSEADAKAAGFHPSYGKACS